MCFPGQRMLILSVSLTESAYQIVKTDPKEGHYAVCFRDVSAPAASGAGNLAPRASCDDDDRALS
jgi:hypothetical protein